MVVRFPSYMPPIAIATRHGKVIYMSPNQKRIIIVNSNDSGYVTVREAATLSGRTIPTIYRWLKEGRLTRYRTGTGRTLIKREELDALLVPERADY